MTNEVATYDAMSYEELARIAGQANNLTNGGISVPRLRINRSYEDEQDREIPPGTWVFASKDADEPIYAKSCKFRPFINSFQYVVYDAQQGKYTNRSVIVKNFQEDAIDMNGGLRCGKVRSKDYDSLSEEEKVAQRDIKMYRLMFGQLYMEGATADGTEHVVEYEPCLWRTQGRVFMTIEDVIRSLSKRKILLWNSEIRLDIHKEKVKGGEPRYLPVLEVEREDMPLTEKDMELLRSFDNMVNEENKAVVEAYKQAHKSNWEGFDDAVVIHEVTDDT